MKKFIKKNW